MALVVCLRFFELLRIERGAAHVVNNRADTVDGREIVGILVQHLLKFRNRLLAHADVVVRRRAWNVLVCVGGGQI